MITINTSREISASLDRIWNIIADVDNEPKYWHGTKTVKNISRDNNRIEREVTIAFKDSRCRQTVLLNPNKSVEIIITEGPIKGTKTVMLHPLDNRKTRIDVVWKIKLTGFLSIFSGMVKGHISKGTDEALVRIAEAAE
ncbi:MAG: SRPBCC family protein [Thermoproteota archaeon]|jgi:ribosome-associated toxin RatA of RatAB toxin-antitoxin module|nr:SRPBCC family protein [Thermoproteota archaeon]MDQ3727025.1 SRPBCC family protein [Thermoproteota archaeon]